MKNLEKLVFKKFESNPKRLQHIKGVIKVSVQLAKIHGVDENDAYLAALFHDYTKYDDLDNQRRYLDQETIDKYQEYPFVYHAYSAANQLKELMSDVNNDVLVAIKSHIWGRPDMTKLERILLIADKSEPSRIFREAKMIYKYALTDLNSSVTYLLKTQLSHLERQGITPHPELLETLTYYLNLKGRKNE